MLAVGIVESFARLSALQMVLLAISIAAITIMLGSTGWRVRRSRRRVAARQSNSLNDLETGRSATRDLENVMVELNQLSREVHGRLDVKIAKLERLLRDADARIARLESTPGESESRNRLDVVLDDTSEAPMSKPEHQRIYQMADKGLTAAEIAKKSGRLTGEVELILSLRRVAIM